jgi:hypothetical protein
MKVIKAVSRSKKNKSNKNGKNMGIGDGMLYNNLMAIVKTTQKGIVCKDYIQILNGM